MKYLGIKRNCIYKLHSESSKYVFVESERANVVKMLTLRELYAILCFVNLKLFQI
jgi:hypothetical protein